MSSSLTTFALRRQGMVASGISANIQLPSLAGLRMIPPMNDDRLAYDFGTGGPAVILLHSTVCDRRMWREKQDVALMEAGYRIVCCDLRGYGESSAPTSPYNDADDVLALLNDLRIDTFAIVGSSYGGQV